MLAPVQHETADHSISERRTMPIEFKLPQRLMGFSMNTALPGEKVDVATRELIGPGDALHLNARLEGLQESLLGSIPGLPLPSRIDHLVVVIRQDLTATAYVNELEFRAKVKVNRSANAGDPVYVKDIEDVVSVDLGVDLPVDNGVVVIRSLGWKRSVFYDFGPLDPDHRPRAFPIEQALAQQALMLMGIMPPRAGEGAYATRIEHMEAGRKRFVDLLKARCESEGDYQELFEQHPWMFGGHYTDITRHKALDDKRIPDFTGRRCYDSCLDIVEIKQPFLTCFRQDGKFGSGFNDAWNQAEEYLTFTVAQRLYLLDAKGMRFENPICVLVVGHELTPEQRRKIAEKESRSNSVRVRTFDEILKIAESVLGLMKSAGERVVTAAR